MAAQPQDLQRAESVHFTLDGQPIGAYAEETIWEAARRYGVVIPHLCCKPDQVGLRSDGNCRVCMCEVEGERQLQPSCWRKPTEGMKVHAHNERAVHAQKMVLELLEADMPDESYVADSRLDYWAHRLEVGTPRFSRRMEPRPDLSHAAIAVNLAACIQCTLCVRACREVQGNDVIGYALRGGDSHIVFDMDDPMGESTCVGCGECVSACPTGALSIARVDPQRQWAWQGQESEVEG
ncbi:MAG TPA: 2Fe-2S iron-sulfur cluster-binding protein [Rhodanobacter sp.]|jgi:formate dehydrogenase major subunit|nr:2Fe-2S iron-sulfur cluster-binding protein [Rhodanobacter sp.]